MNLYDRILGIREEKDDDGSDWVITERKAPPLWRQLLGYFVIFGLLLSIVAGLAFWKRHAIKGYANEWTAENHLTEAKTAWENEQYSVALRRAETSLQLKPGVFEAEQLRFRAARETNDYRLLQIGRILFLHPESADSDKAETMAPLLDLGDLHSFGQTYHYLLTDEQRAHPEIHFQWLRYRLLQNRPDVTLAGLEEIPASTRETEPRYLMLEMRARLASGKPGDSERFGELALTMLEEAAGGSAEWRDMRKETLSLLEPLQPDMWSPEIAKSLRAALLEGDSTEQRELAPTLDATLRLAESPEKRDQILDESIASLRNTHLEVLNQWLLRLGETGRIVNLRDPEQPILSPAVFEVIVRALLEEEQFEEALELLEYPPSNSDGIVLQVMKARACKELDRKPEETSAWRQTLLLAERDMTRNEYLRIAQFASRAGNQDITADALVGASMHPMGSMPASEEVGWLTGYLVEHGRLDDLMSVTQRLLSRSQDPTLINNAIYLTAISGDGKSISAEMIATAEQLAKDLPQYPQMRSTLALLYCLSDRDGEALAAYRETERNGIGWHSFSPAARATLALVLGGNGKIDPFPNVASQIDWSEMTPTERRFFQMKLDPFLQEQEGEEDSIPPASGEEKRG